MRALWASLMMLSLGGCSTGTAPRVSADESVNLGEPQAPSAAQGNVYGEALDPNQVTVPLADLLANPDAYAGRVVQTQGEVNQVCQAMGCWMELRAESDEELLRVPMAGHAFFVPKDAKGRRATVQGTLVVRALSDDHKAHLEQEGATTTSSVSLEATGVRLEE